MKITITNSTYVYIFINIVLAGAISSEPTNSKLINLFYKEYIILALIFIPTITI